MLLSTCAFGGALLGKTLTRLPPIAALGSVFVGLATKRGNASEKSDFVN